MEQVRYKVLIVDDEAVTRELLSTVLSAEGHICTTAEDGADALDAAGKNNFDAVITDIVMPRIDGITLTRELRKRHSSLPIMVITGFSDEHYYEESIHAGATDFINKPFSIAELTARFHKLMRDHKIISQIKAREQAIEKISSEMIAGVQHDSLEKIKTLREEIEELKSSILKK